MVLIVIIQILAIISSRCTSIFRTQSLPVDCMRQWYLRFWPITGTEVRHRFICYWATLWLPRERLLVGIWSTQSSKASNKFGFGSNGWVVQYLHDRVAYLVLFQVSRLALNYIPSLSSHNLLLHPAMENWDPSASYPLWLFCILAMSLTTCCLWNNFPIPTCSFGGEFKSIKKDSHCSIPL